MSLFKLGTTTSLWWRGGSLFFLVVLFQILMARVSLAKETKRRLQHALTGHAMVQISHVLPRSMCIGLLLIGAMALYVNKRFFPSQFERAFGPLLRSHELLEGNLPGAFYFLLGTALTVWLVDDLTIARYAVECLAIADPMASWMGSTIRSPKINSGSSVSGCIACFVTAWGVGYVMLSSPQYYTLTVGALACTFAEAIHYGNDNLNIPLITALTVQKLGNYR